MAETDIRREREEHHRRGERSPLLRSASQTTSTSSFLGISIPSVGLEKEYYWVLFPFLLGTLADFADGAVFKTAYVQIGIDLNDKYLKAWLFLVYTIVMAIGQPIYAIVKDESGWPKPLAFSYVMFSLGLIGCFISSSVGWLLAARLVTATGSAGMVFVPNLFLNDVIPHYLLPNWITLFGLMALLARLAGSLLAGAGHIDYLRWLFLGEMVLPMLALGFVMWKMNFFIGRWEHDGRPSAPNTPYDAPRSQDWSSVLGISPLILSIGCLCAGLSLVVDELEFKLEVEAVLVVIGLVLFGTFLAKQKHLHSTNPTAAMLPTGLNKSEHTNLMAVFVGIFLLNGACSAMSKSADRSTTWRLWAYWIGQFVGYFVLASYTQKYNKTRRAIVAGATSCSVASAVMFIWWNGVRSLSVSLPLIVVYGVGSGTIEAGFRSLLMRALKSKQSYKSKVYNLFHLVITVADLIFTATSNVLLQNTKSRGSSTTLVSGAYEAIIRVTRTGGLFVTAVEDVALSPLSPALCFVMVSILTMTTIIVCFVEDDQLEED